MFFFTAAYYVNNRQQVVKIVRHICPHCKKYSSKFKVAFVLTANCIGLHSQMDLSKCLFSLIPTISTTDNRSKFIYLTKLHQQ